MNPLAVRDVPAVGHRDDVREPHPQILPDDLIHANAGVVARLVCQDDAHCIAPLLALDEHGVSAEEGELFHFGRGEGDDAVVVVGGVVDYEAVGAALLAQEGVFHVFVFLLRLYHGVDWGVEGWLLCCCLLAYRKLPTS